MAQINTLQIIQHNVLAWKKHKYIPISGPHIILINAQGCKNTEEIKIFNYQIIQKNYTNQLHDGAAIAVRRDIPFRKIDGLSDETLAITLQAAHEDLTVATSYCPPRRTAIPVGPFTPFCTYANSCARSMCYLHTVPFHYRNQPVFFYYNFLLELQNHQFHSLLSYLHPIHSDLPAHIIYTHYIPYFPYSQPCPSYSRTSPFLHH